MSGSNIPNTSVASYGSSLLRGLSWSPFGLIEVGSLLLQSYQHGHPKMRSRWPELSLIGPHFGKGGYRGSILEAYDIKRLTVDLGPE